MSCDVPTGKNALAVREAKEGLNIQVGYKNQGCSVGAATSGSGATGEGAAT